eukprot:gene19024-19370_t
MVKDQNTSLALELGGFEFKPHINEHSKKLSVSMKKLCTRIDEIQSERERFLLQKKKESDEAEVAGCTFEPTRYSEKTSDLYLRRMGREEKVKPEDLFKYQQDKMRRNELRRQILREIEEKELTFKPALNEKTIKIQEKMVQQGSIDVDQVTRTTRPTAAAQSRLVAANLSSSSLPHSLIKDKDKDKDKDGMVVVDGPTLVVESVHPYKHNTSEYSTVQVPGAVSYSVSFSDNTRTEAIYDFVRFYDDETHTHHFGSGKYSGGTNGSPMNWPGVGNRPALFIPSPKFVIYFKTNGSVNDWGFKMHITPHISVSVHLPPPPASPSLPGPGQSQSQGQSQGHGHLSSVALLQPDPHIPSITAAARNYGQSKRQGQGQVHERLYQQGLEMKTDRINYQADLFQSKIKNLPLKPWEAVRDPHGQQQPAHKHIKAREATSERYFHWMMYGKTYLAKATLAEAVEELLLPPPPPPPASRRTRGRGEANQDQDFYGEGDGDGEQKDGDGGQGDGEGDFQGEGDVRQTASSYSAAYATVFTAYHQVSHASAVTTTENHTFPSYTDGKVLTSKATKTPSQPFGCLRRPELAKSVVWVRKEAIQPPTLTDLLRLVHDSSYLTHLEKMAAGSGGADMHPPFYPSLSERMVDNDTPITAEALSSAKLFCGAAMLAVDLLMQKHLAGPAASATSSRDGAFQRALVVGRPPGHHAGPFGWRPDMTSSGFCLLNSVAVAAAYARHHYGRLALTRSALAQSLAAPPHHSSLLPQPQPQPLPLLKPPRIAIVMEPKRSFATSVLPSAPVVVGARGASQLLPL